MKKLNGAKKIRGGAITFGQGKYYFCNKNGSATGYPSEEGHNDAPPMQWDYTAGGRYSTTAINNCVQSQ